jgi:hypothetical protein
LKQPHELPVLSFKNCELDPSRIITLFSGGVPKDQVLMLPYEEKSNEWLQVDLGKACRLEALQINFADQSVTNLNRLTGDSYQYFVEVSQDVP